MSRGFADAANFPPVEHPPEAEASFARLRRAPHLVVEAPLASEGDAPPDAAPAAGEARPFTSTGPWGHRGRMRDRLLEKGAASMADYELLEMLFYFANPRGDTKPLAKATINRFGSFAAVLSVGERELRGASLNTHAVAAIKLVQEAAVRLARSEVMERPVLGNWEKLMDYLTAVLAREAIEQFRILFLDSRNRLLADEAQARGTVNHTPVYPREVVKRALELHATALILVHNHPSGDPTPSREDLRMTGQIRDAAEVLGIVVHDHVIVGNGKHLSFRSEGLL